MRLTFEMPGNPIGKPRMTQRDKWKKRPAVERYWAWKDACVMKFREACGARGLDPEWARDAMNVVSVSWIAKFQPPKSHSKKKLATIPFGETHRAKPDRDNIDKALLDALFKDDSGIGPGSFDKIWVDGVIDQPGLRVTIEYQVPS